MSDPKHPKEPPDPQGGNPSPPREGVRDDELDFETDALLDSLLNDPFPPPLQAKSKAETKVESEPDSPIEDAVDPFPAEPPFLALPTPQLPPPEVTAVAKGLHELVARSAQADSFPPRDVEPKPSPERPPVPRPHAPLIPDAGAARQSSHDRAAFDSIPSEDDETRLYPAESSFRDPEAATGELPAPSPAVQGAAPSLRPESFVPPAAFLDSESPGADPYARPNPDPPKTGLAQQAQALPLSPPIPILRAELESLPPENLRSPRKTSDAPAERSLFAEATGNHQGSPSPELTPDPSASDVPASLASGDPSLRSAWLSRAEWLEREAHATRDPRAKARALLVVSELWAIGQDPSRARDAAQAASSLAGRERSMASRQVRWLDALADDHARVAESLELEARSASTPEARQHAAYLAAEVQRLALGNAEASSKKHELLARAQYADPRSQVQKLCSQLAASSAPPTLRWPELETYESLAQATEEVAFQRGGSSSAATPMLRAFDDARQAFARGDRPAAAEAILRLSEIPGLERAGRWLAAALLAGESSQRSRSIEILQELRDGASGASACRALVARALELSDRDTLLGALQAKPEAFSAADQVVLRALASIPVSASDSLIRELGESEALKPLAAALTLANSAAEEGEFLPGSPETRAALALGRSVAQGGPKDLEWLQAPLEVLADLGWSPLIFALRLEQSLGKGAAAEVAQALSEWPLASEDNAAQRDRELLCALVYELSGESSQARAAYERSLVADPVCEPAVRALSAGMPDQANAELFEGLADAEASGSRAALHFVEAALARGTTDATAYHALLDKAVEADPKLVIPYRLGEQLARRCGDAERLLTWLRARRASFDDPMDQALSLVREALLLADSDLEMAASLLREASQARPSDFTIAELYERVAPCSELGRAVARESAAEYARGASRRRLLLEAALEYERAQDKQGAARAARAAVKDDLTGLARVMLERVALDDGESTHLAEELIARAKATDDVIEQREIFDLLSEIDAARGNHSSALLWQNAILERAPRQLPALRKLEHAYLRGDRLEDLEPIWSALAEALPGADAVAAARLAARLRLSAGNWPGVRVLSELAVRADPNSLWALRTLSAHASAANDSATSHDVERRLFDRASRPADKATLALRAAEAAARLDHFEQAQELLERALEHSPGHPVVQATLADVLERRENWAAAAQVLEALARTYRVTAHQVSAWYGAGIMWLDHVSDPERGRLALERATELDLGHEDAVVRLQAIYVALGDRQRLAALLQSRLDHTDNPEERVAIEVARGRALSEIGEPAAARAALSAALDANPDHLEALQTFSELCLAEGDWLGAEQALIRLARRTSDPEGQARIYAKLGELYDASLPNPERAELAYQEVLKRLPNDTATADRLIAVYARLGASAKAVQLATELLEGARNPEERREHTLRLAAVLEQIAADRKQAEGLLEKARREWPHDAAVIRALTETYLRGGEERPAQLLLERAAIDARRALGTGRFEPALFETLATVAALRGLSDGAAVAHATLAALAGDSIPVPGAGASAGSRPLDDLVAPDLLAPPLRALLEKAGTALDLAYPLDLQTLRTAPMPPDSQDFQKYVASIAEAFSLSDLLLLSSPVLGMACLPGGSSPPTLVIGQALLRSDDDAARYCLLIRALTILKARASAIARTAPIDLGPMLGGLLAVLVPGFSPQGVDPRRLAQAQKQFQEQSGAVVSAETTQLALEVSQSIGNRASQLATALCQWGNRSALLATGAPTVCLRALAIASGSPQGLPATGPDRVRWIVRSTEARDLMIFSVSDAYLEAREKLGLSASSA